MSEECEECERIKELAGFPSGEIVVISKKEYDLFKALEWFHGEVNDNDSWLWIKSDPRYAPIRDTEGQ